MLSILEEEISSIELDDNVTSAELEYRVSSEELDDDISSMELDDNISSVELDDSISSEELEYGISSEELDDGISGSLLFEHANNATEIARNVKERFNAAKEILWIMVLPRNIVAKHLMELHPPAGFPASALPSR